MRKQSRSLPPIYSFGSTEGYVTMRHLLAYTFAAFALAPCAAYASLTTYTNRADFLVASTGVTTFNFAGIAPANGKSDFPSGLVISGTTFTDDSSTLSVIDPGFDPSLYDWGSGAVLSGSGDGTITVSLPAGTTAIASDLMSVLGMGNTFTIRTDSGDILSVPTFSLPQRAFVGFTSDTDISSVTFSAVGAFPLLDNFSFGSTAVAVVPEGGTITLLAFGGVILSIARRKLR